MELRREREEASTVVVAEESSDGNHHHQFPIIYIGVSLLLFFTFSPRIAWLTRLAGSERRDGPARPRRQKPWVTWSHLELSPSRIVGAQPAPIFFGGVSRSTSEN
jgi:hypothetical protein